LSGYEGVFEGLCHTAQTAFAEVPDAEAEQICKALLFPYFFYCVFHSCTRFVFNLRRYGHLSTRRNELLGVPLFDYFDFRVLSFFFKLILTQRPGCLFADLIGVRSVGTSSFIFLSVSPGASVFARGICLWNQLPLAIKNVRSVAAFERSVMRTNLT
jgi:hypothetical protein